MFFRALGLTMVVSLLVSLLLAVTLTPSLAAWLIRGRDANGGSRTGVRDGEAGFVLRPVLRIYEAAVRWALRHAWLTLLACGLIFVASIFIYRQLETDFLPDFDEGGFVMDYNAPPGTSLAETSRVLDEAETKHPHQRRRGRLFPPARHATGAVHHRTVSSAII